jgi:hypothetical protein
MHLWRDDVETIRGLAQRTQQPCRRTWSWTRPRRSCRSSDAVEESLLARERRAEPVGNVPSSSFWPATTRPTNGEPHFHVYYGMTTSGSPPADEWYSTTSFTRCEPPAPIDGEHASAVGGHLPYGADAAGTDFQCSAITWL